MKSEVKGTATSKRLGNIGLLYAAVLLRQMHFHELAIIVPAHPHPGGSEADTVSCVRTNASNKQKRNAL